MIPFMGKAEKAERSEQRSARRMHDDHTREEAELRRAQQREAGDTHHPVRDKPFHGEQPVVHHSSNLLNRGYEDALRREAQAWKAVHGLPGDDGFSEEAWEDWRDAVEEREKATRMMINCAMNLPCRDSLIAERTT